MGLDIRWPIGLMFSLIGVLLLIWGVVLAGVRRADAAGRRARRKTPPSGLKRH
jgi:hypothetical protein